MRGLALVSGLLVWVAACGRLGFEAQGSDGGIIDPGLADASPATKDAIGGNTLDGGVIKDDAGAVLDSFVVGVTSDGDDGCIVTTTLLVQGVTGNVDQIGVEGANDAWAYVRFALPRDLPAGTVIGSAAMVLEGGGSSGWSSGVDALRVYLEDSSDAPVVDSYLARPDSGDAMARPLLGASVRWPEIGGLAWNMDFNTTANLAPLLQQLIDQNNGLAAGKHVQFWLYGDNLSGTSSVSFYDLSNGTIPPAQMLVSIR